MQIRPRVSGFDQKQIAIADPSGQLLELWNQTGVLDVMPYRCGVTPVRHADAAGDGGDDRETDGLTPPGAAARRIIPLTTVALHVAAGDPSNPCHGQEQCT